jgi:uncharacterized membrane protein
MIFLGNIITGFFWMAHAEKTKDPAVIAHTMRGIINSDRWFTLPAVIIIIAGGFGAAINGNLPLLRTGWIFWGIVFLVFSEIALVWKVVPLQRRIYRIAKDVRGNENRITFWQEFQKQYKAWELWRGFALLTPLAALVLMILKMPATTFFFN